MDETNAILDTLIKSEVPEQISGRIDAAFESFILMKYTVKSHQDFNCCIADFIQHIYKNGLLQAKLLCHKTAIEEAIDLLERYYDSQGARGYDTAYLDALEDSGGGVDSVLRQISEILKGVEISKWINSYFVSVIDPLDKDQHLEIIKTIFGNYPSHFPKLMTNGNPARFISLYRELIESIVSSEKSLSQIAGPKKLI
jgi:hypothetical protein